MSWWRFWWEQAAGVLRADPERVYRAQEIRKGVDGILREAGLGYPLGLRGVRDLVNQRDGHLERAREAEDGRDRVQQALMAKLIEAGQQRERAEEAERRLANVREMVRRLRHAEPVGSATPGYVLRRIEDMLNGQEPT